MNAQTRIAITFEEAYGIYWRKLAKKEGHRRGFPKTSNNNTGPKPRPVAEMALQALNENEWMTYEEIQGAVGCEFSTVAKAMSRLKGLGKVERSVRREPFEGGLIRRAVWRLTQP